MSDFSTAMEKANSDFYGTFGDTVTYTPKASGTPVSITAIIDDILETVSEERGEEQIKFRPVTVLLSDLAAAPAEGDKITISGVDWYVTTNIETDGAGNAQLQCRWSSIKSVHHETHKHKLPTS